jgi:hypothetical protein
VKPASWPRYMVEKRTLGGLAYYWRPPGREPVARRPVHREHSRLGGAVAPQRFEERAGRQRSGERADLGARFKHQLVDRNLLAQEA